MSPKWLHSEATKKVDKSIQRNSLLESLILRNSLSDEIDLDHELKESLLKGHALVFKEPRIG